MTEPPTAPAVQLVAANPKDGCTAVGCGRLSTTQLHPYWGRLCPDHVVLPTIPDGPYRRDLADDMVDLGRAEAAFAYLRAWLAAEIDRRFCPPTCCLPERPYRRQDGYCRLYCPGFTPGFGGAA